MLTDIGGTMGGMGLPPPSVPPLIIFRVNQNKRVENDEDFAKNYFLGSARASPNTFFCPHFKNRGAATADDP